MFEKLVDQKSDILHAFDNILFSIQKVSNCNASSGIPRIHQ